MSHKKPPFRQPSIKQYSLWRSVKQEQKERAYHFYGDMLLSFYTQISVENGL